MNYCNIKNKILNLS